jgi:hypothetical protein
MQLTFVHSSSWKRINPRVVKNGTPNDSFPPSQDALVGVKGLASQRVRHSGCQGHLDEEEGSSDEDEPDD